MKLHSHECENEDYFKTLAAISKCKKLKKLMFEKVNFLNGIEEIECFPNLETFEIRNSNIRNNLLAKIVSKSPKLKYCFIKECKHVDNKFIDLVSKIKNESSGTNVLHLNCIATSIVEYDFTNLAPLISIKF